MQVILYKGFIHNKNAKALSLYKNTHFLQLDTIEELKTTDLSSIDFVYSPSQEINVQEFPNTRFVFGPHFSVFPNNRILSITGPNTVYIQPSQWAVDCWKRFNIPPLRLKALPFGVDTDTFVSTIQEVDRKEVFVYFKRRDPNELLFLQEFLNKKNVSYKIFHYENKYSEQDYLECLKNAKYGIWLDTHESQGFALQEALSCNVPLFVWNVTSLNQEYGSNYPDIYATTVPYWDERCGELFYSADEMEEHFETFLQCLKKGQYNPRAYIMENLSIEKCEEKWENIFS